MQTDFFLSALFRSCCKPLSVISAAGLTALITSFIHQLGRVILCCDELPCIVCLCYLKNNLRFNPHQPVKPLSVPRNIRAIMLITCEKPFIYWLVKWKGQSIFQRHNISVWWLRWKNQYFIFSTCLILFGGGRNGGGCPNMHWKMLLTSWQFSRELIKKIVTLTRMDIFSQSVLSLFRNTTCKCSELLLL